MKMREIRGFGSNRVPITAQLSDLDSLAEKYLTGTAEGLENVSHDFKGVPVTRSDWPFVDFAEGLPDAELSKTIRGEFLGASFDSFDVAEFSEPFPDLAEEERHKVLEAGGLALRKVIAEGEDVDLEPMEALGLEAIVHIEGRPAIFIQNGRFFPPPQDWLILEQERERIEHTLSSVGRIEISGHPSKDWVGTGFLVARDVVLTNRHVAEVFCQMGNRRRWQFKSGMSGQIDYVEELGGLDSAEFEVRSVIGVHNEYDMALFRVSRTSNDGAKSPEPLTIATNLTGAVENRDVYTIGYPAWDGQRNDPPVMQRIFSNVFNVKRLQPGKIMQMLDVRNILLHDCSTLGGNSGSCVVDLETHQVIGLHFGGRYLHGNVAIALWKMIADPLLQKARVRFA